MQKLSINMAHNFLLIAGFLAVVALVMNVPHVHSGKGHHELTWGAPPAASAGISRECAGSYGDETKQTRHPLYLCKRCTAVHSIFDVICPTLFFSFLWAGQMYFVLQRPPLSPADSRRFHHPP